MDEIFNAKQSIRSYPFIIHYKIVPLTEGTPFQITVSAPKRIFKKAHDRNRIKRLMREAIRKNKLILESYLLGKEQQVALFMIYTAKEELDYDLILSKTMKSFSILITELEKQSQHA